MFGQKRKSLLVIVLAASLAGLPAPRAEAQQAEAALPEVRTFTVPDAVDYALQHYPAVRAAMERYNAARAGVGLARTSYLPRLDSVWQGDRGSRESVLGVLLPQSPNILTGTQGSVTPHAGRPFWTSGAGVLLSWDPFDFGYRRARVHSAETTEARVQAQVTLTRLGIASAVAEASLGLLASEQRVRAMEADVHRREVFARAVHALVDAHLRPGADASRADAEVAMAKTRLILSQEDSELGSIALGQLMGLGGKRVEIAAADTLLISSPDNLPRQSSVAEHPAARVQEQRVEEEKARIRVLNHEYYPRFTTEGLLSARGSGEKADGSTERGLNGLGFTAYNWEAGLTVQMDLTSIFAIRARKRVEVANRRQEEANYTQTLQVLTAQQKAAAAKLDGARRIAQNTPVELASSRQGELRATARFRAGLGTTVDVAEAQSLLAQAEMDDSVARLSIWRALVAVAEANGDLTPFLDAAKHASSGGK